MFDFFTPLIDPIIIFLPQPTKMLICTIHDCIIIAILLCHIVDNIIFLTLTLHI